MADIPEHAVSLINLGDTYTINGNRNASETYLKAWDLLSQTPELTNLRESIFSSVTRISPTIPPYNIIARRPSKTQEGEEIFIKATFSVRPDGRVSDINLIEGNAPVDQKKLIRLWLRTSKFRPRIEEREFVLTEGLTLTRPSKYSKKNPPKPQRNLPPRPLLCLKTSTRLKLLKSRLPSLGFPEETHATDLPALCTQRCQVGQ